MINYFGCKKCGRVWSMPSADLNMCMENPRCFLCGDLNKENEMNKNTAVELESLQEITIDNFAEVLRFNGWISKKTEGYDNEYILDRWCITWNNRGRMLKFRNEYFNQDYIEMRQWDEDWPFFLQYLESKVGKLKQLPIKTHRSHWVLSEKGKEIARIYPDKVDIYNDCYHFGAVLAPIDVSSDRLWAPKQRAGAESSFQIITDDLRHIDARWVK